MSALLHIFDADDHGISATARSRTVRGARMLLGITGGVASLVPALDALPSRGTVYDRILFETHGSPGRLYFNHQALDANWVLASMKGRRYEALCPQSAHVYFNGCNVAAGREGMRFLRAMASVFLLAAGGVVFGHTSLGYELPLYSGFTGRVVHVGGEVRRIYYASGGRELELLTEDDL